MLITIDSNIPEIAQLIASYLGVSNGLWCTNVNQCQQRTNYKPILYNTPISMADSLDEFNFPKTDIKNFVYIDHRQLNTYLNRIMKNISNLQTVVLLSNADIYSMGTYLIGVGNSTNEMIAEFIASVIQVFQMQSRLVHPDEIKKMIRCNNEKRCIIDRIPITNSMYCDLYSIFQYRRQNSYELDDCRSCTL